MDFFNLCNVQLFPVNLTNQLISQEMHLLIIFALSPMYELALSAADTPGPCPSGAIGSTCQNKATDTECRLAFADDPIVNE